MANIGCTNPAAVNYDSASTIDDGSCVYLHRINNQCLQFVDATNQVEDKSFTLSFDLSTLNWAFYHDYFPDFYIHTRDKLYNVKNSQMYINNEGEKGKYHDNTIHPFYLDVVFPTGQNKILNTVAWVSEVVDQNKISLYSETITAITIWNNYKTSGKIFLNYENLSIITNLTNSRNTETQWSFNKFRNIANNNTNFISDIFNNFAIIPQAINENYSWFNKQLIDGNYFVVRFEFDNIANKEITLHDLTIT